MNCLSESATTGPELAWWGPLLRFRGSPAKRDVVERLFSSSPQRSWAEYFHHPGEIALPLLIERVA